MSNLLFFGMCVAAFAIFWSFVRDPDRANRQRERIGLPAFTPGSLRFGALLAGGLFLAAVVLLIVT